MTSTKQAKSIQYPESAVKRAERALRCSPFKLSLFTAMGSEGVFLQAIAMKQGVEQNYTQKPLSEPSIENHLMWLIQVGLLRREVDGQGITDSFRLTPLGRQIVAKWEKLGDAWPAPSWLDRIFNFLHRWLPWPI